MKAEIFRQYDIRGVVDRDLDDPTVFDIGRALGAAVLDAGGRCVVVGRDGRESSERFRERLCAGLQAVGCDVVDVGLVPTPVVYFAANIFDDVDGLAMITGSHNPPDHNGFKIGVGKATMHGEAIQALRQRIEAGDLPQGQGSYETRDALTPYQAFLAEGLDFGPRRPKLVVDAGNGVGAITALPFLEAAGFEVVGLYTEVDGAFPNHEADPTVEANLEDLKAAVAAHGAELGVAYDGDADRVGVIDKSGEVIWGDRLMVLFTRQVLEARPGAAVVGEVKCSKVLYDEIAKLGGQPIMWAAGHSLIKAKMRESGALLGGEMSGHIFFADRFFGFDDACYATGRLLEILSRTEESVSELLAGLPETFSTAELRVDCPEDLKFRLVEALRERLAPTHELVTVDGVRVVFPDGWGLVRASNTQPLLVLRFEAESQARLDDIRSFLEGVLAEVREGLEG